MGTVIDDRGARVWTRIRAEAPELAALLREVRDHFGPPAELTVHLNGEPVWPLNAETAEPEDDLEYPDAE